MIRLIVENDLRVPLRQAVDARFKNDPPGFRRGAEGVSSQDQTWAPRERVNALVADLFAFLADRLKVVLREQGKRHDLVDAVFALGDDDWSHVARVEALDRFLETEPGQPDGGSARRQNPKAESKKTGALRRGDMAGRRPTRAGGAVLSNVRGTVNKKVAARIRRRHAELAEMREPGKVLDEVLVNDRNRRCAATASSCS